MDYLTIWLQNTTEFTVSGLERLKSSNSIWEVTLTSLKGNRVDKLVMYRQTEKFENLDHSKKRLINPKSFKKYNRCWEINQSTKTWKPNWTENFATTLKRPMSSKGHTKRKSTNTNEKVQKYSHSEKSDIRRNTEKPQRIR